MNNSDNPISEQSILWLSILATSGLVIMWVAFWFVTLKNGNESVTAILKSPAFFRTITVMGVIAATVVLSLAGRLQANITGAIMSGIVGYVLGSLAGHDRHRNDPNKQDDDA